MSMNIYQGTFTSGIVSHTHYNYNAVSSCKMPIYHGKSAPCKRTYILRPDGVRLFKQLTATVYMMTQIIYDSKEG